MNQADRIFFNLTNHRFEKWTPLQLDAARRYGEIEDIPFPNVSPLSSSDDIARLADVYVAMIQSYPATQKTVHVMGELTFSYAVVSRLKALKIKCVASTTQRSVIETDDGKIVHDFQFVQFREY